MARNTYALVPAARSAEVPMLKIRNADNRNQRRLAKRVARFDAAVGGADSVKLDNGTLLVFPLHAVETMTVKRDAEREARKTGRKLVTLSA